MKACLRVAGASLAMVVTVPSALADEASCHIVRLADLGWTDLSLTNATASVVLTSLGYDPQLTLLGLPVTYEALKTHQVDAFLGNWRPVQDEQFKSYFDNGDVDVLTTNLMGAKFTLAVPTYVAEAGVKSYGDLQKFSDKFNATIYGIEPGSNQPLLDMVAAGRHGLKDWKVIETSEAGMLGQVDSMTRQNEWVVFLGWEPHPMNIKYKLTYLTGGDVEYGPNFGGGTVRTISRKGYRQACPNVAKFLENLHFNVTYENVGMNEIASDGAEPVDAAKKRIRENPELLKQWLAGVKTESGADGYEAAKAALLP